MTKERVNYVITKDGQYCGHTVNMPLVIQAESMEELQRRMKSLGEHYIKHITEQMAQEQPFEYVLQSEQSVKECDATKDDSSNTA
jgi:hypothetical protein